MILLLGLAIGADAAPPELASGWAGLAGAGIAIGSGGLVLSAMGPGSAEYDPIGALGFLAGTGLTLIGGVLASTGSLGQAAHLHAPMTASGVGFVSGAAIAALLFAIDAGESRTLALHGFALGVIGGAIAQGLVNRRFAEGAAEASPQLVLGARF